MILEIMWVFVVLIEVLDNALLTRPHEDFMIRISEVVRETTAKVSRAKYENFAFRRWRTGRHRGSAAVYVGMSNGSIDEVRCQ
jgi:hypothetical protein